MSRLFSLVACSIWEVVSGWGCSEFCATGDGSHQDFKAVSGRGSWEQSSLEVSWVLWP